MLSSIKFIEFSFPELHCHSHSDVSIGCQVCHSINQAVDVIGKFGNGGSSIYVEAKIKEATKKVADIAYIYLVFDIFIHDNCSRSYKTKTFESTKDDPIQSIWKKAVVIVIKYPDNRLNIQHNPKNSPEFS